MIVKAGIRHGLSLPLLLAACGDSGSGTDAGPGTGTSTSATSPSTTTPPTTTSPTTAEPTGDAATGTTVTTEATVTATGTTEPVSSTTEGTASTDTTVGIDTTGAPEECTPGQIKPCYTGPEGTDGVGQCTAGGSTCGDDATWGPCVGEVLPGLESCDTPGDENCDDFDPCVGTGGHLWSKTWGGPGGEVGVRIGFDGAGDLVVAAHGTSSSDFGGGPLPSAGESDLYLAKFGPDGSHLWSKRFGDAADQFSHGWALAVAPAGDIVVGGYFNGSIDFGGGPLPNASGKDLFLARLTGAGDHMWSKSFEAGTSTFPTNAVLDLDSNIYIVGYFGTTVDFGGGTLFSAGSTDVFVAKFSAAGAHVWSQRFGGADFGLDLAQGVGTDIAGNVYIAGTFTQSIDFGLGPLQSSGGGDIFVTKLSPIGNAIWARHYGGAEGQAATGLVVDSKNRITFSATTQGPVDFGGGPIPAAGPHGVVVQLDDAGTHLWSKLVADCQSVPRVAVDGFDSLLLTGSFMGTCDFGGGPLISGKNDIFTLKLGPGGEHVWSKRFGDFNNQEGSAAAGSSTGKAAFVGTFEGGVNFGGGPVNSKGSVDGFVAVFDP